MAVLKLTSADSGKTIEAKNGDDIVVELPENATTGYRWRLENADRLTELETPPRETVPQEPGPNALFGRGGVREFRFRTHGPGRGRLGLKYWQEWEGEKSVLQRFTVDINITS
jgi:inhibitor of cysteine peptidase